MGSQALTETEYNGVSSAQRKTEPAYYRSGNQLTTRYLLQERNVLPSYRQFLRGMGQRLLRVLQEIANNGTPQQTDSPDGLYAYMDPKALNSDSNATIRTGAG